MKKSIFQKFLYRFFIVTLRYSFLAVTPICVSGQAPVVQIQGVQQIVDGTNPSHPVLGLNVILSSMIPPGSSPQFYNIYAQIPGNPNVAWVAVNMYLDTFRHQRILNRSISLQQLGIPDNTRIPNLLLSGEQSLNAIPHPQNPFTFVPYNCPIHEINIYNGVDADAIPPAGIINYTPLDFIGPIQANIIRACDVPNVDLDNSAHPATGTYAGDKNACAPASLANSLSWIQTADNRVGKDGLTERERLEELSGLMSRAKNSGVSPEQIIQAKISFIANHELKLKVEYRHATGNFNDDIAWLKAQYDAGQDIELNYSYVEDGQTKSHAVVITDFKITGNVPQISFKDDSDQDHEGGIGETIADITRGQNGELTFTRFGNTCTINDMYAESYDENAGAYIDPKTGNETTTFCKRIKKTCEGSCPALISFYNANQQPVVTYPVCDAKDCCNIYNVYTAASGACKEKKSKCKGLCDPIYKSKSDASRGANPIQGDCDKSSACICIYDVSKKYKDRERSDESVTKNKLEIYPNPATQQITVGLTAFDGMVHLNLLNVIGESIIDMQFNANHLDQYNIDVSRLESGLYFITISDEITTLAGSFVKE